ncbi:hypothetical protein H0H87_001605 [Tephrocybe sp. NHM501043]|nr:hypothetical protein H0H87_001605 [Tephrocybe sp. NHM501043]
MSSFQRLPQELFCAILSHLSSDHDRRACALTCRAFVSPTQADLYRTLSLFTEDGAGLSLKKLENAPHLATFIKHISLKEIHKPWIELSEALPALLALLAPYTYSLEIHQRRGRSRYPRLPYSLLSRLGCVEQITLSEETTGSLDGHVSHGDNALPTFLNHFPKLRAITFLNCVVENKAVDVENTNFPAPVFQLERVDICSCEDRVVLDWLTPALSSLQTLRISSASPSALRCIAAAGQSLQHLEARNLNNVSDEDLQLLMSSVGAHAKDLRSLTLSVTGPWPNYTPVQVIVQALLHLDIHAHLQRLAIEISQREALTEASPWNEVQDILLGTRFPAFRSVECRLVWGGDSVPLSRDPILAAAPRLAKKNMIWVSTTNRRYY